VAEVVCLGILVADVFASPLEALPAAGELSLIDKYLLTVGGCAANNAAPWPDRQRSRKSWE
jgi:sugar/nucleoside kinase (ribokinase family)